MASVNYGIGTAEIDRIAASLGEFLANTHLLYVKTRNYHWNLEDSRFQFLHELFEKQYDALAESADAIAERIRSMGRKAPATLKEFLSLGTLKEGDSSFTGDQMIDDLAASHEATMVALRKEIDASTDDGDLGTADLLTEILRGHEKTAWFLRSHL